MINFLKIVAFCIVKISAQEEFETYLSKVYAHNAEALMSNLWNPHSALYKDLMSVSDMTNFINFEDESGQYSKFTAKMNAPVGPSEAEITMHHHFSSAKINGKSILENEIVNKMVDFPFSDYFDVIQIFKISEISENSCRFEYAVRQNWVKKSTFIKGIITKFFKTQQTEIAEITDSILTTYEKEKLIVLPNFSNPQYNSDTFVSDEISVELDDNLNVELEMLRFRSEEISDDIDSFEIPNLFTLALCGSILAGLLCTICMIKSNNKANSFTITKTANKHQNMLESSKSDGQYNHRPSSGDVSLDMSLASDDSRNFLIK